MAMPITKKVIVFLVMALFAIALSECTEKKSYSPNTVEDLKKALKSGKPVLLEMYTDTCPQCKKLAPIIEELEREYGDKIIFIKINANANEENVKLLCMHNPMCTVPTVVVFDKNGDRKSVIIGYRSKDVLENEIKKVLG